MTYFSEAKSFSSAGLSRRSICQLQVIKEIGVKTHVCIEKIDDRLNRKWIKKGTMHIKYQARQIQASTSTISNYAQ